MCTAIRITFGSTNLSWIHSARAWRISRASKRSDNQQNGNNGVNWLKVVVDPDSREVFSYQPQIVQGSRTAVPAP